MNTLLKFSHSYKKKTHFGGRNKPTVFFAVLSQKGSGYIVLQRYMFWQGNVSNVRRKVIFSAPLVLSCVNVIDNWPGVSDLSSQAIQPGVSAHGMADKPNMYDLVLIAVHIWWCVALLRRQRGACSNLKCRVRLVLTAVLDRYVLPSSGQKKSCYVRRLNVGVDQIRTYKRTTLPVCILFSRCAVHGFSANCCIVMVLWWL